MHSVQTALPEDKFIGEKEELFNLELKLVVLHFLSSLDDLNHLLLIFLQLHDEHFARGICVQVAGAHQCQEYRM